jgi:hypothetical protein
VSHEEYDPGEPVPGLPEVLPEGEVILWQGAPGALAIARKGFHGTLIAIYFGALAASSAVSAWMAGAAPLPAFLAGSHFILIGAIAFGIIALLGYIVHRTTLYTVTSKRIVMRFGMALPMTLNIPFTQIAAADVKLFANGAGDVAFTPKSDLPLTYAHLWPHARGLKFAHPQPTLRCVPDAKRVSDLLTKAILAQGVAGEIKSLKTKQTPEVSTGAPSGVAAAA